MLILASMHHSGTLPREKKSKLPGRVVMCGHLCDVAKLQLAGDPNESGILKKPLKSSNFPPGMFLSNLWMETSSSHFRALSAIFFHKDTGLG